MIVHITDESLTVRSCNNLICFGTDHLISMGGGEFFFAACYLFLFFVLTLKNNALNKKMCIKATP